MLLLDFMNRKSVLQIKPELLRSSEKFCQTRCHLRSNISLLSYNVIDGGGRNMQFNRQPVRRDVHRPQELFTKNLSGMNRPPCLKFILDTHNLFPLRTSVIIGYFHVVRVLLFPNETHAKLIVDADAVLTFTITFQWLQTVTWWNLQIIESRCGMHHSQFPLSNFSQI